MSGEGLVLKAQFSRRITITCAACESTQLHLKLLADTLLSTRACDRLLTEHLDHLGWTRLRPNGADICPECAATRTEVCPQCMSYGGGHTSLCPTQRPGATP